MQSFRQYILGQGPQLPSRPSTPTRELSPKEKASPSLSPATLSKSSSYVLTKSPKAKSVEMDSLNKSIELSEEEQKKITNTPFFHTLIDSRLSAEELKQKTHLRYFVFGCAGDGGMNQKLVAQKIAEAKVKPDFIIILGDNFYNKGVDSPTDPAFKTKFENFYIICGVPCFVIPGNHDYNIWRYGTKNGVRDVKKIVAQSMHTYLDKDGKFDPVKLQQFKKRKVDLAKLKIWNMASRFGCHRPVEGIDLLHLLLDTNTIVTEFVELMRQREKDLSTEQKEQKEPKKLDQITNQAEWLEQLLKENPTAAYFIFAHHPIHTVGKRSVLEDGDEGQYLDPADLKWLRERGFTGNYNDILRQMYSKLGIKWEKVKLYFAAHDHLQYYYADILKNIFQVVAGGGGGHLQDRVNFLNPEKLPVCESSFGYVDVNVDLKTLEVTFGINNIQGGRYQFSPGPDGVMAQRESKDTDENLLTLRKFTLQACDDYFRSSKPKDIKDDDKDKKDKGKEAEVWSTWLLKYVVDVPAYIRVPEEFKTVTKIKNYFQEFKKKDVFDYLDFLRCAPAELKSFLDAKFEDTKYGTFEKFRSSIPTVIRSKPITVPKEESPQSAAGKSLGGSPEFRGAEMLVSPAAFFRATTSGLDDVSSPSNVSSLATDEGDEADLESISVVVGEVVSTSVASPKA